MDRLNVMAIFVAVAEQEGFAGASRLLNISPPAVTRAIAALEEHLGVKLFNRTTRFVRLTEAGQRYLEDARRIIAAADEADEAATGINAEPKGHLVVTAPVLFGRLYVMPGISDYLQRYQNTEVTALFLDRIVNLLEEGVDVGIRIGELPDSSYNALRVGQVRRVLCASPSYLSEHGIPSVPDALVKHQLIVAGAISSTVDWRFEDAGSPVTIRVKPRLRVTSNDSAIEAAMLGLGITRLLSYQIATQLASGELKIIMSDFEPKPMPINIIHREGRYDSAKIRSFIDLISMRLKTTLR
ncbi:LysR family transcriptional regulator [Methylotenera versatilis]|uniref:LysR family transcriptional regulator n=1 Tax=Methylotenera versatilis TaxID=1055487 RepID=UPI000645C06F|nr:LysR family transcriptional regulator [Methylotenera versatilis]